MNKWITRLRETWSKVQERINAPRHKASYEHIHWVAHGAYFAAVSVEGHGLYALTAVVLLALTVLAPLFGGGD